MPAPTIHAFAEKVALIAGGDTPVGRAVAIQLALQGSYVIVASTGDAGALDELERLGTLASHVAADVATVDGARTLAAAAGAKFGRIDLLVNCLKSPPPADFETIGEEAFDAAIASGTKSAFFVVREALELMKTRPKARIVNVIGVANDDDVAGAAVAASVLGMTKSLARALPKKFRINAVTVSGIASPSPSDGGLFLRPEGAVSPDDVARTVLFLLSGEAAGLNGEVFNVR